MVGGARFFLNAQGPELGKKQKYGVPTQGQRIMHEDLGLAQPNAHGPHRLA
jgi:hypothetical protein